jgi:hypothetical protein
MPDERTTISQCLDNAMATTTRRNQIGGAVHGGLLKFRGDPS